MKVGEREHVVAVHLRIRLETVAGSASRQKCEKALDRIKQIKQKTNAICPSALGKIQIPLFHCLIKMKKA